MADRQDVVVHDNCILNQLHTTSSPPTNGHTSLPSSATDHPSVFLIVLNNTLDGIFDSLYQMADLCIFCDGAANRVYAHNKQYTPDVLIGDFDSIQPDVLQHYKSAGSEIVEDTSVDATDLHKALQYINKHHAPSTQCTVIVYNAYGGRLDQEIGCMHTLYTYAHYYHRLLVLNAINCTELLCKGRHEILLSRHERPQQHCGFWSLHGDVQSVTTTGLVYNVQDQVIGFNGLISYCNVIDQTTVTINTSGKLVWNTELVIK